MSYTTLTGIYDDMSAAVKAALPKVDFFEEQELGANFNNIDILWRFELDEFFAATLKTLGQSGSDTVAGVVRVFFRYDHNDRQRDVLALYDDIHKNMPVGTRHGTGVVITKIGYGAAVVSGTNRLDEIDIYWEANLARP